MTSRASPRSRQQGSDEPASERTMQALSPVSAQQGDADATSPLRTAPPSHSGAPADAEARGFPFPAPQGRARPEAYGASPLGAGQPGGEYGRYSGGYGGRGPYRAEEPWRAMRSPHETSWTGRPEPGAPHFDAEYHRWRAEQVRQMDHDYETWRQERYEKFCEEFDRWRASRANAQRPGAAGSSPGDEGNAAPLGD